MRECLFFVADKNIRFALEGFFKRDGFHHGLGCTPFDPDPARDIRVAEGQNAPGLYARANLLIQPFRTDYRRVVIILDVEWDGSPGKTAIVEKINGHIHAAGRQKENGFVIVVEPEADNWLWADSPHTAAALGWENMDELRQWLADEGDWPHDAPNPPGPKESAEKTLRKKRKPRSSTIYREAAGTKPLIFREISPRPPLWLDSLRNRLRQLRRVKSDDLSGWKSPLCKMAENVLVLQGTG